ncbi:MAG: hypothetical protein H2069_07800 [Legionella sp.]|nr:hypothetical protein [Legionella sp.]
MTKHLWQRLYFFILVLACLTTTSCGFQLRGLSDFPSWLNNVAIVIQNANPELENYLKAQFAFYQKTVCKDPSRANYILIIEGDDFREQITNVSASTTPRLFLMTYTVKFSLMSSKGATLISSNVVRITRQLTINNNRLLGSDLEEAVLKNEMRKEAVIQLFNRLALQRPN